MKKFYIILSALCSLNLSAQDNNTANSPSRDSRDKLHAGIKAGVNRSGVYDKQSDFTADGKLGFAGGLFFAIPIGQYLGVHPEVLISQKGFNGSGDFLGSRYEMKRTTTYLDIPLLVAFKPSPFVTLLGGPQYSYLIHKSDVFKNGQITTIQEQAFTNENIRRNILSAAFGIDVNISRFVISGRYDFDLQQNNGDGTSESPQYKNSWFQFTLGVRI